MRRRCSNDVGEIATWCANSSRYTWRSTLRFSRQSVRPSLAETLCWGRALSRSAVPLLKTAERAGNLPWALTELADLQAQGAARRIQRVGLAFFPLPVIGVGIVVGVVVLGLFMPLITLLEGLSQ